MTTCTYIATERAFGLRGDATWSKPVQPNAAGALSQMRLEGLHSSKR